MHMPMSMMGGEHGSHGNRFMKKHPMLVCLVLFQTVFCSLATVCFLGAINRAANSFKLVSRVKVLKAIPEAFTEDERLELIQKIKGRALGPF
jgi:hypothetical protein